MKQVEVQIMGQGYVLGCPEGGEERLHQAVQSVDQAMSRIRNAGKIKARDRIAVLAALNLAFDLADRPALAAAPQTEPGPEAPAVAVVPPPGDHADDATVVDLLHRLDAVLGADGQLL
jgi:cell division protein ZapA